MVVETRTQALTLRQLDPDIALQVAMVSQPHLIDTLTALTGFRTRHSLSSKFSAAADWYKNRLELLGYTVSKRAISVGTGTRFNVVTDKLGSGTARRLVIVMAHLDSVNSAGGITAAAPGADDNGSGVAGVMEIARIFTQQLVEHDLRLTLFGGEEQGLHGSQQYVASLDQALYHKWRNGSAWGPSVTGY